MNENALRMVVVSDSSGFVGVVADGDIRRFFADGGKSEAPIDRVVNRSPITLTAPLSNADIMSKLTDAGVEYLPCVLDGEMSSLYALLTRRPNSALSAVIMAGGLGSRLRPLTDKCPKPLLELGGKPVIEHIMRRLHDHGVSDFTVCVNYLGEMIEDRFGDGTSLGFNIRYVYEDRRLGTGGALSLIDHNLTDPFLSINGDLLTDFAPQDAVATHVQNDWAATMVVRNHSIHVPYGVVQTTDSGEYVGSDEKPTMQFSINSGIYVLSHKALALIPHNSFYDLPTVFDELRESGQPVGSFQHRGQCIDIGTMDEWVRAERIFTSGTS